MWMGEISVSLLFNIQSPIGHSGIPCSISFKCVGGSHYDTVIWSVGLSGGAVLNFPLSTAFILIKAIGSLPS